MYRQSQSLYNSLLLLEFIKQINYIIYTIYKQHNIYRMLSKSLPILFLILASTLAYDSLVIVTTNTNINKFSHPVLDEQQLKQYRQDNDIPNYVIDAGIFNESVVRAIKQELVEAGMTQDNINSFMIQTEQLHQQIQPIISQLPSIPISQISQMLQNNPQSIMYILNKGHNTRILQQSSSSSSQQLPASSKLFLNMTPAVLSGLFVTVFLIVMLLIAISCLYDIKTNDKFAANNLFVGKES